MHPAAIASTPQTTLPACNPLLTSLHSHPPSPFTGVANPSRHLARSSHRPFDLSPFSFWWVVERRRRSSPLDLLENGIAVDERRAALRGRRSANKTCHARATMPFHFQMPPTPWNFLCKPAGRLIKLLGTQRCVMTLSYIYMRASATWWPPAEPSSTHSPPQLNTNRECTLYLASSVANRTVASLPARPAL